MAIKVKMVKNRYRNFDEFARSYINSLTHDTIGDYSTNGCKRCYGIGIEGKIVSDNTPTIRHDRFLICGCAMRRIMKDLLAEWENQLNEVYKKKE